MKIETTFSFTDKRIKQIKAQLSTKTYSNNKFGNLKLVVTPNGTKTFYVRFKAKTKSYNEKLGSADLLSLNDARHRAVEFINYIRGNITAQSVRDNIVSSSKFKTVHDVFKTYRDNELCQRQTIAGRTHALEVSYECHIKKKIGQMPIEELTKKFTRSLFRELESLGYSVHNRCLSAIKSAFNYVLDYEDDSGLTANPFGRIKKLAGVKRSRYLTHKEAKLLLKALDVEMNQDVADIYRMALFTGARLSNVKTMQWHDIDLISGVWLIPASNTKTAHHYEIPLHDYVLDLLKKRGDLFTNEKFVFPSKTSKYGYITGGDPIWKSSIKRAGLYHENPNIRPRPHDLRRTFATWQIQSGADISVVSKALCHTSLKHTMVYAHTNVDQVRESVNKAFDIF
ncbi:site-specific integrase [Colwellia sp. MB3u-55]|uniref:tyrosine-type recombinase/integrase n=1 Tax=Colwellia sp. MB3u-55 TaxID=2759810 RepID=UPI0015F4DD97|nr:site-specific integrase [Colwellia sp. MB3u-55]MBA6254097.1 site-specific integrase [Colwellia sp. MB3u-55]